MKTISELLDLLNLEQLETNLFRGQSMDIGSKAVFGGQVLAQALNAATRTVPEERLPHSMHGYFILPGDLQAPIVYEVDTIRDGRSFTTRRVVAIQHGKAIFNMAASYQIKEEGLDHQIEMLNVPPPESLATFEEHAQKLEKDGNKLPRLFTKNEWPIDFRPVEYVDPFKPGYRSPFRHVWFRTKEKIADDKRLHRYILSYASDYNLLVSALLPHNVSMFKDPLKIASIDHAMWFHRDFRIDEWLLYAIDSPSASNARGFSRGSIFSRDGRLVASVTQEGLIRLSKPKPKEV